MRLRYSDWRGAEICASVLLRRSRLHLRAAGAKLLAGPGTFKFAIKADNRGNVAVRALAGNTASLIVSELNGDGTYQVKPSEEVLFHNGKLADPDHTALPECGCPVPPPVQRAAIEAPKDAVKPTEDKKAEPPPVPLKPVTEQHLEAAVPFIYQAGDPAQEVVVGVARLRLTHGPVLPGRVVLPPPPPPKETAAIASSAPSPKKEPAPKRGFFGKVGAFFAAIFH
jgi:hypothetical protein